MKKLLIFLSLSLLPGMAVARLPSNKDKFPGNITTGYAVDYSKKYFVP